MLITQENAGELLATVEEFARHYDPEVEAFVRDVAIIDQMMRDDDRRADWRYPSFQALLFDLGTPRVASLHLPDGYTPMEMKQCYHNSYTLALTHPELTYVEGLASCRFFPVDHAWLEDPDGRIIDPTWTNMTEYFADTATYLGVRFDTEYLIRHADETQWISFFQTDDMGDLIRTGFVMDHGVAIDQGEA